MFLESFPNLNHEILSDNFDIIKEDYHWAKQNNLFVDYQGMDEMLSNPKNTGHYWQAYPLIYNKELWPGVESSMGTLNLINNLRVKPILATFSILTPHSQINSHQDHDEHCIAGRTDTTVVKYHLGISSNKHCGLVVNGETRIVLEGKFNIFDESSDHWAFNNSDDTRGVLILSFLRSELAPTTELV